MSKIFVDTSAYYALVDQNDEGHQQVTRFMQHLAREWAELFTTNYIVAETHTLLLNRMGYRPASEFLQRVLRSQTTSIYLAREADVRKAAKLIGQYSDKKFSLEDAISFVTMERLHLKQAFTLDSDFAQYGFIPLP